MVAMIVPIPALGSYFCTKAIMSAKKLIIEGKSHSVENRSEIA
jgi:hypothetical protein